MVKTLRELASNADDDAGHETDAASVPFVFGILCMAALRELESNADDDAGHETDAAGIPFVFGMLPFTARVSVS